MYRRLVGPQEETEDRTAMSGESAPATSQWGMLYVDDAVVVSQSLEYLIKVTMSIVTM